MVDRERAIELVAQAMVDAYSSNDCPRAPDIEEATKIVDGLLALTDSLVSDLEHRLRVLAEAAVEDEAEIERLRVVEDAARVLARCADPLGAYPQTYQALQVLRATLREKDSS